MFQIMEHLEAIRFFEAHLIRKDGLEVIMETNGVPFFDDQGNLLGYRGISQDISERKQTETHIRVFHNN